MPRVRFQELLQALQQFRLMAEVGHSKGELTSIADLVDSFIDTPQMDACIKRFRALPGGNAIIDSRYPALQPNIAYLQQLPKDSLGFQYSNLILKNGYDPEFFRPRTISSDGHWLTQRIATTHDIHHVIGGFATTPEGESGVLAITACQIGFPAYVMLNNAAAISSFRLSPTSYPQLSASINHGIAMGFNAEALAIARWEEGWERPLGDWRQELGITKPANGFIYGLKKTAA